MKNIKYTIKIKEDQNPPDLKLGKGIVAKVTVAFDVTDEEFESARVQTKIFSVADMLLHEWFEVVPEVVEDENS